jgi:2-keto-4-pentenoate hydratase
VIAAIASPERCCHSVLSPATCVPSQSATTTMQKAKKLGELVKFEAAWAMRSKCPRPGVPRSVGCCAFTLLVIPHRRRAMRDRRLSAPRSGKAAVGGDGLKARTEIHPRIVAALDAQLAHWRAAIDAGAQRVGWKMGLDIEPVEALIGGDPVIGHLTSATVIDSGQAYSASASRELRAETEVAIVVGDDVAGDADLDRARDAIAGCAVTLELVDVAAPPHDLEGIVEANVYHRAVAFGPPRPWIRGQRSVARALVNERPVEEATLADDYAPTVRAVAQLLAAVGERLQAGDRILSGSLTHVPVGPGDHVAAIIDDLGSLDATITA